MKLTLLLPSTLLFALAAGVTLPAAAQFNGPGLSTGVQLNQPAQVTTDRALLYPSSRDVQLAQGDLITVHVFGDDTYNNSVRIGNDGKVLLPLIGVVTLDHLTVTAAEELIAHKLAAAGMYVNPQVTIQITEGPNAVVTVVGEAHGVIPVTGPRRLYDVLALAGGLPPTASHVITIDRPGVDQPIVVDLGTDPARSGLSNVPVFPGDTIIVSHLGIVYVIGAFTTQGAIPLSANTPLTLLETIALAGGPAFQAKTGEFRIIRTNGETRSVVRVDLKKVLYGKAPDPILQANDILFLPTSLIKASITNGSLGTLLGIVSLGISTLGYIHNN